MKRYISFLLGVGCLIVSGVGFTAENGYGSHHPAHTGQGKEATAWNVMTPVAEIRAKTFSSYRDYEHFAHQLMMSDNSRYLDGEVGNAFAVFMTAHHQAAIITSMGIQKASRDKEVVALAKNIVEAQSREVKMMQALIASDRRKEHPDPEFGRRMHQIMQSMMREMKMPDSDLSANQATQAYLENMIVHHRAAIEMAQAYLEVGEDAFLRKLSEEIVLTQTEEIARMQKLLGAQDKTTGKKRWVNVLPAKRG